MKAGPGRALLLVIGILLVGWGLLPRQSIPAAAAPLLLITETATGEPPTRTPTTDTGQLTPVPTEAPTSPPAATPTSPPPPPDDGRPENTPTPTATATATATPIPTVLADPVVSKSVSPSVVTVGDRVTYTIVVANLGGSVATGVVVEDTLPSIVSIGEVTADRGEVTVSGNTVRVVIGDLAPGETVNIRISAQVTAAPVPPNNTNLALVSSESPDANLDNNQASAALSGPPPVTLPGTSGADAGLLPTLATVLGLALIAGSLLLRRRARQ